MRLKGGDPFVFGRGGEEAEFLADHGIPFEVVPGVTSAVAAPAYAGIPVTHRTCAASVAFVTGHRKAEDGEDEIQVPNADTLVYLMGVTHIRGIAAKLLARGRSPETPGGGRAVGDPADPAHRDRHARHDRRRPSSAPASTRRRCSSSARSSACAGSSTGSSAAATAEPPPAGEVEGEP